MPVYPMAAYPIPCGARPLHVERAIVACRNVVSGSARPDFALVEAASRRRVRSAFRISPALRLGVARTEGYRAMNERRPPRHIPVLGREAVEWLAPRDGGVYMDATFGAGGYSRAILDVPGTRV